MAHLSADEPAALPGLEGPVSFAGVDLEAADRLAERLVALALERELTIATAESCTAGLMAHTLSQPIGSASVLVGGFVTYTKAAKRRMLDVSAELFARSGAVDPEVAKAMAAGAASRSGADCAIALTGVTGPTGDEDGNPVGRVFVGLAIERRVFALHCAFGALAPNALNHLAMQAAFLLALARLGDSHAAETLARAIAASRVA